MGNNLRHKYAPSPERGIDWRDRAACLTADPELFFATHKIDVERAKDICRKCPVIRECLMNALGQSNQHGVAGGLSESERKALKRKASNPAVYARAIERALENAQR